MNNKNKSTAFAPSKAFLAKENTLRKSLFINMQSTFIKDLQKLNKSEYADLDIYDEENNISLKHSAIVKTYLPEVFNMIENNSQKTKNISLAPYFNNLSVEKRNLLKTMCDTSTAGQDFCISYLNELLENTSTADVKFKIGDELFPCHKFILCARCDYFSLMFNGHWSENEQNVIELKAISKQTFRCIIDFIYKNKLVLPQEININEMAYIIDMYNFQSFKQVFIHHLKAHYCHFFHAPCQFCIEGVFNILDTCNMFNVVEIVKDCNKWFVRYYTKLFTSRSFGKVPKTVQDHVVNEIKKNITTITVAQNLKDISKVEGSLPSISWAEPVKLLLKDIELYCLKFVCDNLNAVTRQPSFIVCLYGNRDIDWSVMLFEYLITAVKKYCDLENCIDIFCHTKRMKIDAASQRNKPEMRGDFDEATIERTDEFLKDMSEACSVFIRRYIIKLQRTTKWKALKEDYKIELTKNSGFVSI